MPGKWPSSEFPFLDQNNHKITSKETQLYNCIAWAAGETHRWWWPDPQMIGWWPPGVQRSETMQAFIEAYQTLGFALCFNLALEEGLEKIALFGITDGAGNVRPTHAALQLESGEWTSKLGPFEDISHLSGNDVRGPVYGDIKYFLSRPRPSVPHPAN